MKTNAVSTHSRAKAAAVDLYQFTLGKNEFQHTAARRRLRFFDFFFCYVLRFQHTAARRRLPVRLAGERKRIIVSTHSRAEAAAILINDSYQPKIVSTHSRAEAAANY